MRGQFSSYLLQASLVLQFSKYCCHRYWQNSFRHGNGLWKCWYNRIKIWALVRY